jgi:hypothetical protein
VFNTKNLRNLHTFLKIYHTHINPANGLKIEQKLVLTRRSSGKRIWVFSNMLLNREKFGKPIWMEKMRIFLTFSMVYCMHPSDKHFENRSQKTVPQLWIPRNRVLVYLKLFLNHEEFGKKSLMRKLGNFHIFTKVYHMHNLDKRFKNQPQNIARWDIEF